MQSANDVIVHSTTAAKMMGRRFTEDLSAAEMVHRPTPKANCCAWLLGHLTLSNRRAAQLLGVTEFPALPEGFEKRFARDETAPCAVDFGDTSQLLSIYEQSCDTVIEAARNATLEQLNAPLPKPFPMFKSAGEMANFMAMHAAMHVGQITIIRRSLGRPPIV